MEGSAQGHVAKECPQEPAPNTAQCYKCQQTGHIARNCSQADGTEAAITGVTGAGAKSATNNSRACYTCGKTGHTSAKCFHNQNKQNTARNAAGKVIKCYSCGGLNQ